MERTQQQANSAKRRTTLTLPAESLTQAEHIARARNATLSTVISEALAEGLRMYAAAERSEEILSAYRKAFAGFSEQEMMLLDGIVLEGERRQHS